MGQRAVEGGLLTEQAFDSYSSTMGGGGSATERYGKDMSTAAVPPSPPKIAGSHSDHHASSYGRVGMGDTGGDTGGIGGAGEGEPRAEGAGAADGVDPSAHSMSDMLTRFLPRQRQQPQRSKGGRVGL
jgi:hypothetical protein